LSNINVIDLTIIFISLMKPGNEKNYDYMAKLLILGDSEVGKTNVLMSFCDNNYTPYHLTTIGKTITFISSIINNFF